MSVHKKILQRSSENLNDAPKPASDNFATQNNQNKNEYRNKMLSSFEQHNSIRTAVRLTSERFPRNEKMKRDLAIPLSAVIQPYCSTFNVKKMQLFVV